MKFIINRTSYFRLSVILLVCGAIIYPLFRGPDLLIWKIISKPYFWEFFRISFDWTKNGFLSILIGSGPDCLWLMSVILFLRGLWFFNVKIQTIYILLFYIIVIIFNTGQFLGIIPGIFCIIDLLTMLGVALAEGIIYNFLIRRRFVNEKFS